MKTNYSISIPEPCHEDWSKMTPNEKGKFCKSCSKTVVDFTKMDVNAIQNYIHNNKNQRICGHIKQSQLNTINLKIPETILRKTWSFNKLFLLALLLAMGTTLLNCSDNKGNLKKIESIKIVENNIRTIDTILNTNKTKEIKTDSATKQISKPIITKMINQIILDGLIVTGDIEENIEEPIQIDSIDVEIPHCPAPEIDEVLFGMLVTEQQPKFKDTPKNLSQTEQKDYFSNRITEIVSKNFNISISKNYDLKGKQRVYTQFKINEEGVIEDIKIRATHPSLKSEAKRVINLLPQFIPAKQRDKTIAVVYTLPIVFMIED